MGVLDGASLRMLDDGGPILSGGSSMHTGHSLLVSLGSWMEFGTSTWRSISSYVYPPPLLLLPAFLPQVAVALWVQ